MTNQSDKVLAEHVCTLYDNGILTVWYVISSSDGKASENVELKLLSSSQQQDYSENSGACIATLWTKVDHRRYLRTHGHDVHQEHTRFPICHLYGGWGLGK